MKKKWVAVVACILILAGAVLAFGLGWVRQLVQHPKAHATTCGVTLVVAFITGYAFKRKPVEEPVSEPAVPESIPVEADVVTLDEEPGELPEEPEEGGARL